MKTKEYIKRISIVCVIVFVSISAIAVAKMRDGKQNEALAEVRLKLWEKRGRMVDLRVLISRIGSQGFGEAPLTLSTYPFQLDVSELGDVLAEDIEGIANGSKITSAGKPESPLMVRWWIVKEKQSDPNVPYALTLMLRVWGADGVEFSPELQQAALFEKNSLLGESNAVDWLSAS